MLNNAKMGIQVKDVMSSPVKTVYEKDTVEQVAKLMAIHDLGSIIVTDVQGNPVGIITERDVILRVVAKNLLPLDVKSEEIMSFPVLIVDPEADIKEAAQLMRQKKIRRLIVMIEGKMIGIITSKDIVAITPALIEIISEKTRITHHLPTQKRGFISTGYCDNCRQWSNSLEEVNGVFLCEECHIETEE